MYCLAMLLVALLATKRYNLEIRICFPRNNGRHSYCPVIGVSVAIIVEVVQDRRGAREILK